MLHTHFVSRVSLNREKVQDFDRYPFSLPAIKTLERLELHPKMTVFVGENGSGKSTLLEAIAVALGFNPEGGGKNFNFATRESHSELHGFLRLAKGVSLPRDGFFLRAESFFNLATQIESLEVGDAYGKRPLHELSHGEAFLALLANRFRAKGLYLLDEPESALSPQRQLAALARIHELVEQGAQFIMATHSPILMAYPAATIYHFGSGGIGPMAYEQTEHYQLMRDFMANPQRMMKVLLEFGEGIEDLGRRRE